MIYYHGQKLCAPPDNITNLKQLRRVLRRLWFFHFHISLKQSEPRHGGERECCPRLLTTIVSRRSQPRQRAAGLRRETVAGNNPFLLHVLLQRQSRIPGGCFTPNAISSYWGTIGRLGELILMLENLIK